MELWFFILYRVLCVDTTGPDTIYILTFYLISRTGKFVNCNSYIKKCILYLNETFKIYKHDSTEHDNR